MNRIWLKKNKKTFIFILILFLLVTAAISIYSLSLPPTTTNQFNGNNTQIQTNYDYKATMAPNILYPNGGTVDAGNTIFKKMTTAIPVNLKSTIHAENQVTANGTHEVQLVIKAGDVWERKFPLEQPQTFEQQGTEISVIDNTYSIDLEKVQTFITQVEQETGITPAQYTLEVVPNIQGTLQNKGEERNFQVEDKLVFQYSYDGITLASQKTFTTMAPFTKTEVITNAFKLFGLSLPLAPVRVTSSLLSSLLLLTLIFAFKNGRSVGSQVEKVNKKYQSRIIPVSAKINLTQKSIFILDSFKSVIKIADEKESPILYYKDQQSGSEVYLIVDGDYLYSYELSKTDLVSEIKQGAGRDKAYARG
ncbi:MAG TPA: DUF5305 family protein [Neobacillus sp.]